MLLFVLVTAYFQPRSERRALALFLVTYLIVTSLTETGLSDASIYLLELALAASLLVPLRRAHDIPGCLSRRSPREGSAESWCHNHYRSGTPSGENRVVDQESGALTERGHDVMRFWRDSDEIESWPLAKKALIPARLIWSRDSRAS